MIRSSTVTWQGAGKAGSGFITSESNAINKAAYKWSSRYENDPGTNPEELLAAAHAACFTMKLSFLLETAGFTSEFIETTSVVVLEKGSIVSSNLEVSAKVPDISPGEFEACANDAKVNCPVSKALNLQITMVAKLIETKIV